MLIEAVGSPFGELVAALDGEVFEEEVSDELDELHPLTSRVTAATDPIARPETRSSREDADVDGGVIDRIMVGLSRNQALLCHT